jgi:16S rRNA processing protein RimM
MAPRKKTVKAHSGSPSAGEPEYLLVGTVRRPHGLRGEVLIQVVTDFPDRLKPRLRVFLGASHVPATIVGKRLHNDGLLIKFLGIDTPEAAATHRNQSVYVRAVDRPPLPRGQYYHHQLLGANVVDETGQHLGILAEILQTGANDVYVVRTPSGDELLLPVLADVVLEIDAERRHIRVRIPAGTTGNAAA